MLNTPYQRNYLWATLYSTFIKLNRPGSTRAGCTVAWSQQPAAVAAHRFVAVSVAVGESVWDVGGRLSLWGLAVRRHPQQPCRWRDMQKHCWEEQDTNLSVKSTLFNDIKPFIGNESEWKRRPLTRPVTTRNKCPNKWVWVHPNRFTFVLAGDYEGFLTHRASIGKSCFLTSWERWWHTSDLTKGGNRANRQTRTRLHRACWLSCTTKVSAWVIKEHNRS